MLACMRCWHMCRRASHRERCLSSESTCSALAKTDSVSSIMVPSPPSKVSNCALISQSRYPGMNATVNIKPTMTAPNVVPYPGIPVYPDCPTFCSPIWTRNASTMSLGQKAPQETLIGDAIRYERERAMLHNPRTVSTQPAVMPDSQTATTNGPAGGKTGCTKT